jgi:hypothetical protein
MAEIADMKILFVALALLAPLPAFAVSHAILNQVTGANPVPPTAAAPSKPKVHPPHTAPKHRHRR